MKRTRCAKRARVIGAAVAGTLAAFGRMPSSQAAVFVYTGPGGTAGAPVNGNFNDPTSWVGGATPLSDVTTELQFGGSGATGYTATDDFTFDFSLNILRLSSSASVAETIVAPDPGIHLNFVNNGATGASLLNQGAGSFILNAGLILTGTSAVTFGGTGTGTVTLAGQLSGAAPLTINNSKYTFTNAVDNFNTGLTTISGGTVTVSAGAVAIGGALTVSGGTVNLGASVGTINGNVTQSIGAVTYTAGNQILDFANLTVNGGTFAMGAFDDTVAALTVGGGTLSSTTGVLTVNSTTATAGTISAIIAGGGSFTKNGVGTTTVSGTNTFTGDVNANAGTITLSGANGAFGGASSVVIGNDIFGTLTLNNATNTNNNRLNDTAGVRFQRSGGFFNLIGGPGGTSETIGPIVVDALATVTLTSTTGASVQLTADSLSRTGGAIDFRGVNGTLGAPGNNPRVLLATAPVADGEFIGPWATWNANDFASYNAVRGVVAYGAYVALPASGFVPTTVYSASGNVTLTGSGNVLALKLDPASTLNLGANNLTVDSGGLVSGSGTIGAGFPALSSVNGTGTLAMPAGAIITVAPGELVINAPLDTPTLLKNGAGKLTLPLSAAPTWGANNGSFAGILELRTLTDQTLTGTFNGPGTLLKTGPARLTLTNAENAFATFQVDAGVLEALAEGVVIDFNNANNTNHLGSNTVAPAIINGGTLKLTTAVSGGTAGAINLNRPITFTTNGGTVDLTNEFGGTLGGPTINIGGTNFGGGSGSLPITTSNSSNAATAVIKWNGGQFGLSSPAGPRDWQTGLNTLKFSTLAGTGAVRIELSNGAGVRHGTAPGQTSTSTTPMPFTIAGPSVASGGDPTSGPDGTKDSGVSHDVGRIMNDNFATIVYTNGLFLEGALQTGAQGAARAVDGNITLRGIASGNPAYASFHGRATGTALGTALQAPGGTAAGINPLYIGVGRNDTLTIEDGAIGVMDLRVRTDQANHNGVLLDAKTLIQAGGRLQFRQSISNFTNPDTSVVATGNAGYHIVRNNIEGQGTTAKESAVDLYLPFDNDVSVASPLGGVEFQGTNVALIVNGSGVGGLRVNGLARPGIVVGGTPTSIDPVANVDKVTNLLSPARLAALTGSGGFLTPAPQGQTFAFPVGGQWVPGVAVGLRAANSNTNGADVSLPAGTWSHPLHVDAGAELVATGVTVSNGRVSGGGTLTTGAGAGRMTVASGASIAPGVGTSAAKLTLNGDLTFQPGSAFAVNVNGAAAGTGYSQLDAGANVVALAGNLAISRDPSFKPAAYVALAILPSTAASGHFDTVSGMDAGNGLLFAATYDATGVKLTPALPGDATVDRTVDFNDLVKLAQNYNTTGGNTWASGDFTGDGNVDFNDLVLLAQNYNTSLPGAPVPGAPVGFAGDLAAAFAQVPEPGTVGMLGVIGAAVTGRRRRRR